MDLIKALTVMIASFGYPNATTDCFLSQPVLDLILWRSNDHTTAILALQLKASIKYITLEAKKIFAAQFQGKFPFFRVKMSIFRVKISDDLFFSHRHGSLDFPFLFPHFPYIYYVKCPI